MQLIQTPWDWYIVRASALIGFLLLYISILAGTISCLPGIRKYFLRLRSLNFHCWISFQALIFAFGHVATLLFHKYIPFGWKDILIPFHSDFEPGLVALGVFSLYIMILLVASSYLRRYISVRIWRAAHFLNTGLYVAVFFHAFYLGTDLKSGLVREVFFWANAFLFLLLAINLIYRMLLIVKKRSISCQNPNQ